MKKLKNKQKWICSEETVPGKKPWSQSGGRRKSRVEMICGTGMFPVDGVEGAAQIDQYQGSDVTLVRHADHVVVY